MFQEFWESPSHLLKLSLKQYPFWVVKVCCWVNPPLCRFSAYFRCLNPPVHVRLLKNLPPVPCAMPYFPWRRPRRQAVGSDMGPSGDEHQCCEIMGVNPIIVIIIIMIIINVENPLTLWFFEIQHINHRDCERNFTGTHHLWIWFEGNITGIIWY